VGDEEDIELLRNVCYTLLAELAEVRQELGKSHAEVEKARKQVAHFRSLLSNALVEAVLPKREKAEVRFAKLRNAVEGLLM
jgi:hypothetical protein